MDSDVRNTQAIAEPPPTNDRVTDSPFSCNVCKKSYTRVDHLARHFRSHTRERPFVCSTCGKSFARIDLLQRHAANHNPGGESADTGGMSNGKRRKTLTSTQQPRASQACRPCAKSKLRCEGSQPCLRCQQKSLSCEYPSPHVSKTSQPRQSIEHSDPGQFVEATTLELPAPPPVATPGPPIMNDFSNEAADMVIPTVSFALPTPSTFETGIDPMSADPVYDQDLMVNFDDLPLIDFLRDIHTPADQSRGLQPQDDEDFYPRDVLDFGIDFDLSAVGVSDADLQLPEDQRLPASMFESREPDPFISRSGMVTPGLRGNLNINASAQAFKESIWLWTPEKDDHGALEQRNLSLPWDILSPDTQSRIEFPPSHQKVTNATRGQILAMVLRTCEPTIYSHVVSNFPNPELLTSLMHNFISFHTQQEMMWIHPATIEVNKESPEFLASMVCYGAAISHVPEIRKLGFAMQEAVRVANPLEFERDNRATRDLRPLQSFALHLDVGLWSGDRRKMEISESFAMPLLTMVRRAGHYRRTRFYELPPFEDVGEALESKWRSWARKESFKRLALYLFYRDVRSSISLLSQPLVSYAELSPELPCSKDLWLAKTAQEWKNLYLTNHHQEQKVLPSLRFCMTDSSPIFDLQHFVDVDLSILLVISTIWPMIWQYREMKSTARLQSPLDPRHSNLTMNSRHQEVVQILRHIQLNSSDWQGGMKPPAWLLHEQCLMHLYVSLEDIQLLAGKEGEEEARRAFPLLTAWVESTEARQALFHAGQVVRAAREYPKFILRDASAVAVYHASLVFWAYAVLPKSDNSISNNGLPGSSVAGRQLNLVRLDGEDGPEVQRFLMLGRGMPCIQRPVETLDHVSMQDVPLNEPAQVMSTLTRFLRKQHDAGEKSCPPLLENLSKLMHSLGNAAVGKKQR